MANIYKLEWDAAIEQIRKSQRFLLISHSIPLPDGDSVGSIVALGNALRKLGKTSVSLIAAKIPPRYEFMTHDQQIADVDTFPRDYAWDLGIVMDCSRLSQAGDAQSILTAAKTPYLVIDHHVSNGLYGDLHLVNSQAVATCEILYDLCVKLQIKFDAGLSNPLLLGLVTDTLGFRTEGVTADVLIKTASLVQSGAHLKQIVEFTLNRVPERTIELFSLALQRAKCEHGVYWTSITIQDFEATGLDANSTYALESYLVTDTCCIISAVFAEIAPSRVIVQIRSVPGFDVSVVAQQFGGGGHVTASGFEGDYAMEEIIHLTIPLLQTLVLHNKPTYR